ncbi:MAG: glycogen/starch/alpha-glucan phosphorylase [Lachnospiraceae bacterium]|nr:glycogen/starch/alpha-glucan phosphorylase [Candidatus Darwinimomas equi]
MSKITTKEELRKAIEGNLRVFFRRTLEDASKQQIYQALAYAMEEEIIENWMDTHKNTAKQEAKRVYYLSMEFLIGRALGNNILNLQKMPIVKETLDEIGVDLTDIEDEEPDPALGNGGLGRLAACFLDSLATLNYPAYGCGIRYHYGMFKQKIADGYQREVPDEWLKNGYPFEMKRAEYTQEVRFGGTVKTEIINGRGVFTQENYTSVHAVPYDIPIVGYGNGVVNTLRIWDAEAVSDFNLDQFDKGNYALAVENANLARTLTEVLYPNDNHMQGKELRLRQQYFFISASLQRAIQAYKDVYDDIHDLPKHVVFQMNDTHPTVAIPELMRLLLDQEGLEWDDAWDIVTHCCAYTNHTIMAEALEKWPIDLFERLLPRVYMIVDEMNRRFVNDIKAKYPNDPGRVDRMAILVNGQIRMAYMAIYAGFSVNGVAALHTHILETKELRDFYEMMPEKFNNKTNGITQRRFLLHANPLLADWITKKIGDGWITDLSQVKKLEALAEDPQAQKEFMEIKRANKVRLAEYIRKNNGVEVDVDSMFDVQVKRLHEYKRQLLNILRVMYVYNKLKENPGMDLVPRTYIFGAKAAAGYKIAKLTIKLINSVADVVNNDPYIGGKMKVVFIEDYRVSNGEIIFAAADLSEQISTASKEASGTGCMKFMLNGAPTIGTLDGANVEMYEELGNKDMFIFGSSSDEIIEHEHKGDYNPAQIFENDWEIRKVLNQLIDGTYSGGDPNMFRDLYNSLTNTQETGVADRYFNILDARSYIDTQFKVDEAFRNRSEWARMAIRQTACAGKFSSDRTIEEYVRDIWHLNRIDMSK